MLQALTDRGDNFDRLPAGLTNRNSGYDYLSSDPITARSVPAMSRISEDSLPAWPGRAR